MNGDEFERIFDEVVDQCRKVLVEKAKEYADDSDRLHNFRVSAEFMGCTPEQALWGFNTKHLVSISDAIRSGKEHSDEFWNEKIGDALNYLILLRALLADARENAENQNGITFATPSRLQSDDPLGILTPLPTIPQGE